MKRISIIGIIIIISLILQSTLFQYGRISPNLLLIVTVAFALIRGNVEGAIIGFFCGLILDIFFGKVIGFGALVYMYIGFLNGFVYQLFYSESLLIPTLMIIVSDFVYGIVIYTFTFLLRGDLDLNYHIFNIILPEVAYTTVFMFFCYKLILHINKWLVFKQKGV